MALCDVGEGRDVTDGVGECVALNKDLGSPRRTEPEGDGKFFVGTSCFSIAAVRSNERDGLLSVEVEPFLPPFSSSLSLSGSSSKST